MSDSIHVQRAGNVFRTELEALEHVAGLLDNAFHQTVESLVQTMDSRGKVVIIGIGKSGNIGRKIAATLTSTGTTSVVLDSLDALHGDLGVVNDGDLILVISYSGETEELLCRFEPWKARKIWTSCGNTWLNFWTECSYIFTT